jgi:hypothetical protein
MMTPLSTLITRSDTTAECLGPALIAGASTVPIGGHVHSARMAASVESWLDQWAGSASPEAVDRFIVWDR